MPHILVLSYVILFKFKETGKFWWWKKVDYLLVFVKWVVFIEVFNVKIVWVPQMQARRTDRDWCERKSLLLYEIWWIFIKELMSKYIPMNRCVTKSIVTACISLCLIRKACDNRLVRHVAMFSVFGWNLYHVFCL